MIWCPICRMRNSGAGSMHSMILWFLHWFIPWSIALEGRKEVISVFFFFLYSRQTFHAQKRGVKYWELLKAIQIMYIFIAVESLKWLCLHFIVWHRSLIVHMFSNGNAELDYGKMDNAALMLAWANKKTAMNLPLQIEVHASHIITQGLSLRLDDCITLIL